MLTRTMLMPSGLENSSVSLLVSAMYATVMVSAVVERTLLPVGGVLGARSSPVVAAVDPGTAAVAVAVGTRDGEPWTVAAVGTLDTEPN